MCTDHDHQGLIRDVGLTRREFVMGIGSLAVASSVGSTASAAEASPAAATKAAANGSAAGVVEREVEVPTAHGTADAVLFHPAGKGQWPAVLVWPDILGLRPVFRELGRRLAAQGYTVLVPNPFYRSKRAPVVEGTFDFGNPADRAKVFAMRGAMSDAGIDSDSIAFLKFLDAQPPTDRRRKAGVHGYCMGGPLSFRTAAAAPERIGAVASFIGICRDMNEGDSVSTMTLEHYPGMTEKSLQQIVDQAMARWRILDARVVHRVGTLQPTDQIVLVVVAGAHRGDAFAACEFIMDYLKTEAPFWKKEQTPQGERWVDARHTDDAAAARWERAPDA